MTTYQLARLFQYIDLAVSMSMEPSGWSWQMLDKIKKELLEQSENAAKKRTSEWLWNYHVEQR